MHILSYSHIAMNNVLIGIIYAMKTPPEFRESGIAVLNDVIEHHLLDFLKINPMLFTVNAFS